MDANLDDGGNLGLMCIVYFRMIRLLTLHDYLTEKFQLAFTKYMCIACLNIDACAIQLPNSQHGPIKWR